MGNQGIGTSAPAPSSERVVFARGSWSVVVTGGDRPESARYQGRALPALLRERWKIRATIAGPDGTYFMLERSERARDAPQRSPEAL